MEIQQGDPTSAELIVIPVYSDRVLAAQSEYAPDLELLSQLLDSHDFTGKRGQTIFLQTPDGPTPEALLVGLGDEIDI